MNWLRPPSSRFQDWHEHRASDRSTRDVRAHRRTRRELQLLGWQHDELAFVRDELRRVFEVELGGSTSLNARAMQLAALAGVTIAAAIAFSDKWLDHVSTPVETLLALLLFFGVWELIGVITLARGVLVARSQWRQDLFELLGQDLGRPDDRSAQTEWNLWTSVERTVAQRWLAMAEHQRVTNESKANGLNYANQALGCGWSLIALQAVVFVAVDAVA